MNIPNWQLKLKGVCHGQKVAFFPWEFTHPTLWKGILIIGIPKPLRNWVDKFIPHYIP